MTINQDINIEKKEKMEYPPIPKDVYQSELLDVNMESRPTFDTKNYPKEEQEMENVLNFQFTLLEGSDSKGELRGRNIWANFVPTYLYINKKGKNKLYKIIEALQSKEIDPDQEVLGITQDTLNSLIGKQCRISVEPVIKGDKTYDNITDWLKSNNDMTPLTDEEKDKATVKKDKDGIDINEEIKADDIPF